MNEQEIIAEIDKIVNKHKYDMGFTAPELHDMRYQQLKTSIKQLIDHIIGTGEEVIDE